MNSFINNTYCGLSMCDYLYIPNNVRANATQEEVKNIYSSYMNIALNHMMINNLERGKNNEQFKQS